MSFVETVKLWAEGVIQTTGYPGIVMLTGLGNANVPIPSEAVLPVGGVLAGKGQMNLHLVALTGTLGSVIGSLVSYAFGAFLGHDFLMKYGHFMLMRKSEIVHAERWFEKWGLQVTLWGRFVPVIRSFVSLPAGMFRSNLAVFTLYSFIGSIIWCYLWTYVGLKVGENWSLIEKNMKIVDAVVFAAIALFVIRFVWTRFQKPAEAGF